MVLSSAMGLALIALAFTAPSTIEDVFFPGSQDGESGTLERPDRCQSCHGDYDIEVEPFFNWSGSMMAQAARDPLYLARGYAAGERETLRRLVATGRGRRFLVHRLGWLFLPPHFP